MLILVCDGQYKKPAGVFGRLDPRHPHPHPCYTTSVLVTSAIDVASLGNPVDLTKGKVYS